MLPPQLHHSIHSVSRHAISSVALRASATAILRATASHSQSRSFWGWRRPCDYESKIDPMFHRFTKYRTLKTRAKLLEKLRRRGRWDWDVNQQHFFTPKHIRWASHSNSSRPRWYPRKSEDHDQEKKPEEEHEQDGFELSQREKEWKDQMEAMRKRIEKDPYEAVFGRRFEPFWSPLVPSWMREEMGLSSWPSVKSNLKANVTKEVPKANSNPPEKCENEESRKPHTPLSTESTKRAGDEAESPEGQLTDYTYGAKKVAAEPEPETPNGQLTSYSYGSATSWDSWTKTTKREEWDSITGETRRYEYDPISNRMVQVGVLNPKPAESEAAKLESALKEHPKSSESPLMAHGFKSNVAGNTQPTESEVTRLESALKDKKRAWESPLMSHGFRSNCLSEQRADSKPVDVPVKKSSDTRKAIAVPTENVREKQTSVYFPSLLNTSVVSNTPKPSALAKISENDLDNLTAEDVRASVGKGKSGFKSGQDVKFVRPIPPVDRFDGVANTLIQESQTNSKLETSLDRNVGQPKPTKALSLKSLVQKMEPAVERMQSKDLPEAVEPDDSAAHESTGDAIDYAATTLPKDWEQQADLLQADRVRRTRGTQDSHAKTDAEILQAPQSGTRWIDMMNARKAEYDANKAREKAELEARSAEKNARLEKTNAMLQSEVQEQKFRMQSHENRYAHKIQSLRKELESAHKQISKSATLQEDRVRNLEQELKRAQRAAGDFSKIEMFRSESDKYRDKIKELRTQLDLAFKQSNTASEKHLERIKQLEKDLANAQGTTQTDVEKQRYIKKVKALREELDIAFKQSSVQGDMHVEKIRDLEKQLANARKQILPAEKTHAEGDMNANVTKFAKDSSKWYKQPAQSPIIEKEVAIEMQKSRDRELVREVREIYEQRYGRIDASHRQREYAAKQPPRKQPQVVEVESDVDLGKALADYEKEGSYRFKSDSLEAEIAAQEREAHEAQAFMVPENCFKMRNVIAGELGVDKDVHGMQDVEKDVQHIIPAASEAATIASDIQWEEPPIYKVLAYDSGNDILSTATTTTNFTGKETPISIQQALSELYQPARFVFHFANLQKDGFQVIHGTKDLLVFKKVRQESEPQSETPEYAHQLEDHGLTGRVPARERKSINPIDGTTYPSPETGSFASPTGFVGDRWDNLVTLDGITQAPSTVSKTSSCAPSPTIDNAFRSQHLHHNGEDAAAIEDADIEYRHYPRVKREERVFSGSRLAHRYNKRKFAAMKEQHQRQRKKPRSRVRFVLGTGVVAAGVAYGVGAVVEGKEKRKKKEEWEERLMKEGNGEKGKKWILDRSRWE